MASTEPRRGEIWLASLGAARKGEPGKNRPRPVGKANPDTLREVERALGMILGIESSSGSR